MWEIKPQSWRGTSLRRIFKSLTDVLLFDLRKSNNLQVTYIYKENLLSTGCMEAKMGLRRKPERENDWNNYGLAKTWSEDIFFLVSDS